MPAPRSVVALVLLAGAACSEREDPSVSPSDHDADSCLIALSERGRFWKVDFEELSSAEQVFRAIWELESEVNDGGFEQYFFNTSGDTAYAVVPALRRIGAERTAAIVAEACSSFPGSVPPRERAERQRQLATFTAEQKARLAALNERFLRYEEDLFQLLYDFVLRNRAHIEGASVYGP